VKSDSPETDKDPYTLMISVAKISKRQRLLLLWGILSALGIGLLAVVILTIGEPVDVAAPEADGSFRGVTSVLSREISEDLATISFRDTRASAGIDFVHFPARRQSLLPEDMGSGLAWGDYDNDGDDDLFLVNFRGPIMGDQPPGEAAFCALYRNNGDGSFTDVAAEAGLRVATFGLGATWADYDDDDDLDLYLSNYGPNLLFRNEGDGTFTDVTDIAGVGDDRFSAGSAWGDYDADGDIDLYVTNYIDFVFRREDLQQSSRQYGSEMPYTLNPSTYAPASNRLYRNNRDGTFTDVAKEAGVDNPTGRSLGAVWFDFDLDGHVDLYVANDVSDNGVFRNRGDGTFEDIGASSLAADYRGAMGLAIGDFDTDGDLDLFVTHWIAQENALFENMFADDWKDALGHRRLFFMDSADVHGLGQISLKTVGWSTGFADFDNDGQLDLWVVNGSTLELEEDNSRLKPQLMHLFRQHQDKGFFEIGQFAGAEFHIPRVARGGAHADFDGDGRLDLAVMIHGGAPLLLHNESTDENHGITLRLRQQGGNSRALGARAVVKSGDLVQLAQVGADGAYLSQSSTDLHFGLRDRTIDEITVVWPDGEIEAIVRPPVDRVLTLMHAAKPY
jgi:enediyne biosynthesis protein E4